MTEYTTSRATKYLPQVAVATTLVTIIPVIIVWLLLEEGVISSPWVSVAVAIGLSWAASCLGAAYWKRRGGHGDVFFSELLLWGWLHRLRGERRLNSAASRLGLAGPGKPLAEGEESVEHKAQLLKQMAAALDAQDPYTDGHSRRVALHSVMVARRMHLPREQVSKIRTAAAVHDIGKLRIPAEVLNKPEALTSDEFELVKRHADEGADIVASMEDPEITGMVRHHHERFDGSGYPSGLSAEQTPLGARIIAVADTFDALTSVRPYRAGIPHKRALDVIAAASGTQLDPVVVRTFLKCYSANRWTVFWTLLAISPSRAVAWLGGRGPSPNFASAGTVAAPAVLAAVFGITLGGSTSLFSRDPLAAAKHPLATSSHAGGHSARARPRHPDAATPAAFAVAALPIRQAVLAKRAVRHSGTVAHAKRGAASSGGGAHGTVGGTQIKNPGKKGGPKRPPTKGVGRPVRHPPAHPTPVPPSPVVNAGNAGGSGAAPTPAPGNPGAPGSNGSPLTKDDCKHGGYTQYGFSNQGQCVADVERGPR